MIDNEHPQSVLADMVQLAPKTRAKLDKLSFPGDETWTQLERSFRLCLAWVEFWKAEGDCPDLGLLNASLAVQVESTMLDATRLDTPKMALKFPDAAPALEALRLDGAVYAKGWEVMRQTLRGTQ